MNNNINSISNKESKYKSESIRIMSYNIQSGCGMDGKLDIDRIKNVIKENNVDILCMQEVEWGSNRYPGNENNDIAQFCDLKYTKHIATRPQYEMLGGGFYGITIASKYPVLDEKILKFPHWILRNPRKAIAVKLDVSSIYNNNNNNNSDNGKQFIWMICTHFQNDITFDENWYQARILMNFCENICDFEHNQSKNNINNFRGLIIAGDLNLPSFSSPIQYLSAKWIQCVNDDTFPANNPKAQLDHIFLHYTSKLIVTKDNKKLCGAVDNNIASDHRPIIAVFEDLYNDI